MKMPRFVIFVFAILLIISIAKNVDLYLKYERLQDVCIDSIARSYGWEKGYILEVMKYSLEQVKPNMHKDNEIDIVPYKERSLNKEFENLNKEIEKDLETKLEKIESH